MEISEFISYLPEVFDEIDIKQVSPSSQFRDLPDWSSIVALSLIAMIDEHYEVKITGDEIRDSKTIQDLFNIVKSKK